MTEKDLAETERAAIAGLIIAKRGRAICAMMEGRTADMDRLDAEADRLQSVLDDDKEEGCAEMGEDPSNKKARERVRQRLLRKFGARGA